MIIEARPADEWRGAIERLSAGDELALHPGDYVGGAITRTGAVDAPIVVRALNRLQPPRVVPPAGGGNALDIWSDGVIIRGLRFGPTPESVHAITLRGASGVTIEECDFEAVGGLAVVETMSARHIVVRRNRIRRSGSTAVYFGCHDGSCSITDISIDGNTIDGVTATGRQIGYGIQIKLNSAATIRNNRISDTKGPSIMVYGSQDRRLVSVVEGNVVAGSRRSSGIVVGGGPAIVRANLAVRNAQAGIALEDYGLRGLLQAIDVSGNTLHGNGRRGVLIPRGCKLEATIDGNIDCSDSACHWS